MEYTREQIETVADINKKIQGELPTASGIRASHMLDLTNMYLPVLTTSEKRFEKRKKKIRKKNKKNYFKYKKRK